MNANFHNVKRVQVGKTVVMDSGNCYLDLTIVEVGRDGNRQTHTITVFSAGSEIKVERDNE